MKRNYFILFLVLTITFFQSCGKSDSFELSGGLEGINTNKLLIVFDDPKSSIDSVFIRDKKFVYSFNPDTITLMRLVSPSTGQSIPVFADKGWSVEISGTFAQPKIKGDGPNHDYQEFLDQLNEQENFNIQEEVVRFSKKHFNSFASAYVINNFLVDVTNPIDSLISAAIEPLTGQIKDSRILSRVRESLRNKKSTQSNGVLSYFSSQDRNGKYVSVYNNELEYTLLNVWASWDKTSMQKRDSLSLLLKEQKFSKLRVINISLDYNKAEWIKACKPDTKNWIETCDFKAWDTQLVKQQAIKIIPTNILIDKNRKVIATDIYGSELTDKINELSKAKKGDK